MYEILCTGQQLKTWQWCDTLRLCPINLMYIESTLVPRKIILLQLQEVTNSNSTRIRSYDPLLHSTTLYPLS